ncbi:uncharacterized protein N7458_003518 [Penicillium daleae]|uniref:Major facilitator superfamily (MFS) profile domain-containing protein n=1 Tax=Penicillium daleae TaxID=63821 RepID=A0AAD6CFK9_9EURO|nr:uncharacterized protein N7458_003518 [Penicillium daleae]KAJ5461966.1 hypothetical protein N7458_003518 [Penicillium daleae]
MVSLTMCSSFFAPSRSVLHHFSVPLLSFKLIAKFFCLHFDLPSSGVTRCISSTESPPCSLTVEELTVVDNQNKNTAEVNTNEDVDRVQEDLQSKVSKPLQFGEVEKLSWIGVAFVLSGSATIITWYVLNEIRKSVARPLTVELNYRGKLYAIFSAKWLYLSSVVLFETGSALCGAALTMNVFIVGRAIAGLGGSGMYLGCLNLLSVTTSIQQRPQYIALTGITWGSRTVLGPVVGGAFAQSTHATWRWAFYINLCIGVAFLPIYIAYLPEM